MRWPNSKAAPAAWSPRPACPRSRWCSMHCCEPGDRLVVPHDCYGGSWRLFDALGEEGRVRAGHRRPHRSARARRRRWREAPKLVWIETPSNPLLRITDLRFVIEAAHAAGALAVVDNTFLSPALQHADRARRRRRRAFDHQVHQRPQRRRRRRGRSRAIAALHEQLAWWANCAGPHRLAVRQLPHAARPAHAGCAPARAPGKRRRAGRVAGRATRPSRTVYYPGLAVASRPRAGRAPAARFRRDAQLRAATAARPRSRAFVDGLRMLHAGRIARRRRKPDRASGDDDPRGDGAGGARAPPASPTACCACRSASRRCEDLQRRPAAAIRAGRRAGADAQTSQTPSGSRHERGARRGAPTALPAAQRRQRGLALLGTGTVGSARAAAARAMAGHAAGRAPALVHAANSRTPSAEPCRHGRGRTPARRCIAHGARRATIAGLLRGAGCAARGMRIVIDATASDAVAARHAEWLAQGIHVVTASKLGQGASLARWRAIRAALRAAAARVTATAPPSVRACRCCVRSASCSAGGDRIHAIAGVLSGSLAWLCNHYDGMRPFSGFCARRAQPATPSPIRARTCPARTCARKLLILARAAGVELEADACRGRFAGASATCGAGEAMDVDAALPALDAPMRERYAAAYKNGEKLRFIARLEHAHDGIGQGARRPGIAVRRSSACRRRRHRQPRRDLVGSLSRAAAGDPGARRRRAGHGGGVAGRRARDRRARYRAAPPQAPRRSSHEASPPRRHPAAAAGRSRNPARNPRPSRRAPRAPTSVSVCSAIVRLCSRCAMRVIELTTSARQWRGLQVAHETAVDLDEVDVERTQVAERAEAGAEVVEREAATQPAQRIDHALRARRVAHRAGLGDLEADAVGGHRAALQAFGDEADEAVVQHACRPTG